MWLREITTCGGVVTLEFEADAQSSTEITYRICLGGLTFERRCGLNFERRRQGITVCCSGTLHRSGRMFGPMDASMSCQAA
jgi:hypothetical protein